MARPIPSLTALHVFSVAGKHQSFSSAAAELYVTQGAVSRQIRLLEDELGVQLFTRLSRRVELTTAGQRFWLEVQQIFSALEEATSNIRTQEFKTTLKLRVMPSVGTFWLMPRLADFTQLHPDIEIRVISSIDAVDLHAREIDIAIHVGALPGRSYDARLPRIELIMTSDWRGILSEELFPDVLVPVYSPLLCAEQAIQDAQDILNFPLIHTSSRPNAWPDWVHYMGLSEPSVPRQLEYGHFFMSLAAAQQGRGVALIPSVLVAGALRPDMIVAERLKVKSAGEYYVLTLHDRSEERAIKLFREWIQNQAQRSARAMLV